MNLIKYIEIVTGPITSEDYLEDFQEMLQEHGEHMIEEGILTNPDNFEINDALVTDVFGLINNHYDSEGDAFAEYLQKVYMSFARFQYEVVKPLNKLQWKLQLKALSKFIDLEEVDNQYRLYAELAA